ncbi:SusE domain-containing protein [Solitalea sp. MAHUQ-68]|uniref:SusE domain-containing protein n=1 Tax=Solitalea agri TaxID=2953739 RepID=A0A9X2F442_9SPHI|nr:SusE domain-containing protein [Solitalea agri]MCO4294387.1 SusE domain-containing protein [Solitalea agri]
MKNIFKKILLFGSVFTLMLTSCKKDEDMVIATDGTPSVLTASKQAVILLEDKASDDAITFSWTRADYGYSAPVSYVLQVDKKGNNFAAPAIYPLNAEGNGSSIVQTLTVAQFNTLLTDLKLAPFEVSEVECRISSSITDKVDPIYSGNVSMAVTTYAGKPKEMYLVGGSTTIGWNEGAAMAFTSLGDGKFESYQYLTVAGDGFKLLPTKGSWSGDLGMKGGSPGVLISDGEQNIPVPANGYYRIGLNMPTLKGGTYTLASSSWGVIGDATPGGWDTDTNMTYDPVAKTWSVTMNLVGGKSFKFRLNDEWTVNLGDDGANGSLEPGGANIAVATSGSYSLVLDAVGKSYTIVKN